MCVLLLAKYPARRFSRARANAVLRKLHEPLGLAVILAGAVHGVMAIAESPDELFLIGSGIILWVLIILLAVTFYARKRCKGRWFALHRVLAAIVAAGMLLHPMCQ